MFRKTLYFLLLVSSILWADGSYIHHEIKAAVNPEKQFIEATDKITIPADQIKPSIHFLLNTNLKIEVLTKGVSLKLDKTKIKAKDFGMDREDFEVSTSITQNKYVLNFDNIHEDDISFTVKFSGKIHNPVKQMGEEYARSFSTSPGIIDTQGVYLGGSSYWVPWFNENLITFELTTNLQEPWDIVSQGKRTVHKLENGIRTTTWNAPNPMEEVYLIAAKFHEFSYAVGSVDVMAFLRSPDENLANKYLETTAQYLEMYRKLVGPYPFSKFALIENFWETGYGMASFTLLGPQVIRFPFILHSSYPHELLHNWWGNSAYVNFETGNWCEGITAYMADHLIKEQRGQGLDYRRSTVQKYTDYVTAESDFPLSKFLSRHNASSEAIGYGKSLMMWNMLREEVGDEQFVRGFQKFYRDNKYKFASFNDIKESFEEVSGKELDAFFEQWVSRTGAPELKILKAKVSKKDGQYKLSISLKQIQKEDVFKLNVPVAVSFEHNAKILKVTMQERQQSFELTFAEEPLLVQIDPQFQLFRKLHPNEIPPALSKIHGSEKILILLPSEAEETQASIYKKLSGIWSKDKSRNIDVKMDNEISELPADHAVWIFGLDNKFLSTVTKSLEGYDANISRATVRIEKSNFKTDASSLILAARHPNNPNSVIGLLAVDNMEAVAGLARKLLHYGKYSYLAFEGTEPTNIAKGQWPAVNSPLSMSLSNNKKPFTELKKRKALATLDPVFNAERLMEYVNYLADAKLKGRAPGTPEADAAADYIAEKFKKAGLQPGADDGSYFQVWQDVVDAKGNKATVKNVVAIIPGTNKDMSGESVVVSAHYDHLGTGWPDVRKGNEGKIHFGADDNASGVAVMLELANLLGKSLKPQRTIVFVAFTLEENGLVGSRYYVKNSKRFPVEKVIGNLNLDTVGRLGKNKLLVLNTNSAREWKFIFMGAGYVTGVDAEMVTQELDASDQVAFIEAGVPAVQFFSGANQDYHRPSDTVDKIDAAGMVKVATFVREGILYLAEREEPLSFAAAKKEAPSKPQHGGGSRSASTGSMPDFSYSGKGVKIDALSDDSPAAKAGLQKGDIIIKLGEEAVENLRAYSNALKHHQPGDAVKLHYLRDGKENVTDITLIAR